MIKNRRKKSTKLQDMLILSKLNEKKQKNNIFITYNIKITHGGYLLYNIKDLICIILI